MGHPGPYPRPAPRLGGVFIGIERAPLPGRLPSAQAQVLSRHFAAALHDDLVTDAGSFGQVGVARLLNGRNVYEYVLTSVVRLDEAVAFRGVELLNCSLGDFSIPSIKSGSLLRYLAHGSATRLYHVCQKQKRGAEAPHCSLSLFEN
jgi:hypothetical protein